MHSLGEHGSGLEGRGALAAEFRLGGIVVAATGAFHGHGKPFLLVLGGKDIASDRGKSTPLSAEIATEYLG
jgi:hypothetical protein